MTGPFGRLPTLPLAVASGAMLAVTVAAPFARREDRLGWAALFLIAAAAVVLWGLLIWGWSRRDPLVARSAGRGDAVTAPSSRRPWWKRKRVWVAAGVWLAVAYPVSLGPMNYAQGRGWIGPSGNAVMQTFYDPLVYLAVHEIPPGGLILAYADWFGELAARHAATD